MVQAGFESGAGIGSDGIVELYGKTYRAIVVYSSALDKRHHKRIDRLLKQDRKQLEADCKQATAAPYYCHEDARAAEEELIRKSGGSYHRLQVNVQEVPKYGCGRPVAGRPAGTALRLSIGHGHLGGSG